MVTSTPLTLSTGSAPVQPALTGLETTLIPASRPDRAAQTDGTAVGAALYRSALTAGAGITPRMAMRTAAGERPTRRRYWSVRDLSRRIWLGRGYELLRHLIRAGILPATKSARSWWIDDRDAAGLMAAFDDRAGKVRAFHGLEEWLRERCDVVDLTPEAVALTGQAGFGWRGQLYVPKALHAAIVRGLELTADPTEGVTTPDAADEADDQAGTVQADEELSA